MAQSGEPSIPPLPGSKHANLKKSFHLGIRPLLTACSREDVDKAFATFSDPQKEGLHRMFIQVIKSLHESVEVEFESLCQETGVGGTLDTVEQLVEEQSLDILSRDKADIGDVKNKLSKAKKDEIYYLTHLLQKLEEKNNLMKARIASLKGQEKQHCVTMAGIEKLRSWTLNYENLSKS